MQNAREDDNASTHSALHGVGLVVSPIVSVWCCDCVCMTMSIVNRLSLPVQIALEKAESAIAAARAKVCYVCILIFWFDVVR